MWIDDSLSLIARWWFLFCFGSLVSLSLGGLVLVTGVGVGGSLVWSFLVFGWIHDSTFISFSRVFFIKGGVWGSLVSLSLGRLIAGGGGGGG